MQTKSVTLRMPVKLLKQIDQQAKIEMSSRSQIIKMALIGKFLTPKPNGTKWREVD